MTGKGQEGAETCWSPCGWCIPGVLPLVTHYSSHLSFQQRCFCLSRCDWDLCWPSGREHMTPLVQSPKPHTSHLPFFSFLQVWKNVLTSCSLAEHRSPSFSNHLSLSFFRGKGLGILEQELRSKRLPRQGARQEQTHFKRSLGPAWARDMLEMSMNEWAELPTPHPCKPPTGFQINQMHTARTRPNEVTLVMGNLLTVGTARS